jgi:ribonuclease-3
VSPDLTALQDRTGLRFADGALLLTALTHSSYANEHPAEQSETNERLEFLGDAVLGLVVAEALYEEFPEQQEGRLTQWRAQLVMGPTLARVAEGLGLGAALRLGRGEEATGGRERERNLERVYEALVGAVMLDRGLDAARDFVRRTLREEFDALDGDQGLVNPKGALQQLMHGESARPEYETVEELGLEHEREFVVEVRMEGRILGRGRGGSKQVAEKSAAREALEGLLRDGEGAADAGAAASDACEANNEGAGL